MNSQGEHERGKQDVMTERLGEGTLSAVQQNPISSGRILCLFISSMFLMPDEKIE